MLLQTILLEHKKHKKSFQSIMLVLLLGLAAATVGSAAFSHTSFAEALAAGVLLLPTAVPVAALLIGAIFGSGLRSEPERSTEEVLPSGSVNRVLASYLASLLYLLASWMILGLVFVAARPGSIYNSPDLIKDTFTFLSRLDNEETLARCSGCLTAPHCLFRLFLLATPFATGQRSRGFARCWLSLDCCLR